jgi:hypothetical protein
MISWESAGVGTFADPIQQEEDEDDHDHREHGGCQAEQAHQGGGFAVDQPDQAIADDEEQEQSSRDQAEGGTAGVPAQVTDRGHKIVELIDEFGFRRENIHLFSREQIATQLAGPEGGALEFG